jgi:hypothetical protein
MRLLSRILFVALNAIVVLALAWQFLLFSLHKGDDPLNVLGKALASRPRQGSRRQRFNKKSPRFQGLSEWRDPDLNRGHHDFQA